MRGIQVGVCLSGCSAMSRLLLVELEVLLAHSRINPDAICRMCSLDTGLEGPMIATEALLSGFLFAELTL